MSDKVDAPHPPENATGRRPPPPISSTSPPKIPEGRPGLPAKRLPPLPPTPQTNPAPRGPPAPPAHSPAVNGSKGALSPPPSPHPSGASPPASPKGFPLPPTPTGQPGLQRTYSGAVHPPPSSLPPAPPVDEGSSSSSSSAPAATSDGGESPTSTPPSAIPRPLGDDMAILRAEVAALRAENAKLHAALVAANEQLKRLNGEPVPIPERAAGEERGSAASSSGDVQTRSRKKSISLVASNFTHKVQGMLQKDPKEPKPKKAKAPKGSAVKSPRDTQQQQHEGQESSDEHGAATSAEAGEKSSTPNVGEQHQGGDKQEKSGNAEGEAEGDQESSSGSTVKSPRGGASSDKEKMNMKKLKESFAASADAIEKKVGKHVRKLSTYLHNKKEGTAAAEGPQANDSDATAPATDGDGGDGSSHGTQTSPAPVPVPVPVPVDLTAENDKGKGKEKDNGQEEEEEEAAAGADKEHEKDRQKEVEPAATASPSSSAKTALPRIFGLKPKVEKPKLPSVGKPKAGKWLSKAEDDKNTDPIGGIAIDKNAPPRETMLAALGPEHAALLPHVVDDPEQGRESDVGDKMQLAASLDKAADALVASLEDAKKAIAGLKRLATVYEKSGDAELKSNADKELAEKAEDTRVKAFLIHRLRRRAAALREGAADRPASQSNAEASAAVHPVDELALLDSLIGEAGLLPPPADLPLPPEPPVAATADNNRNNANKNSGGERWMQALYSFGGDEADELSFREGQKIRILEEVNEAWWRGEVDGQQGLFPSNYVRPLDDAKPQAQKRAVALFSHDGNAKEDELSFKEGNVLTLVQAELSNDEWIKGELNGVIGWVPRAYMKEL